jgi:inorganic pyrophosphatase
VIEIGQSVATVGEIKQVKVLGIIGLLDQDETDWKVVVIDAKDPLFDKINGKNKIKNIKLVLTICLYRY